MARDHSGADRTLAARRRRRDYCLTYFAGAIAALCGVVTILATLYLAIFGSSVTFYLNHWLLRHLTAWMVGLQALIIPVIAVAAGAVLAHEAFGTRELIGVALVIAGVWIALSSSGEGSSAPPASPNVEATPRTA